MNAILCLFVMHDRLPKYSLQQAPDRDCQRDKTSTNETRTRVRCDEVLFSARAAHSASTYLLIPRLCCLHAPPLLPLWAAEAMKSRMSTLHNRALSCIRPLQRHRTVAGLR